MSDQLSLFGGAEQEPMFRPALLPGGRKASHYSLFLATLPETEDRPRLTASCEALRSQFGLNGKCLTADRLHVSLHAIEDFRDEIPQSRIDAMLTAAGRVQCPVMSLRFDRFCSFGHPQPGIRRPQVLLCDDAASKELAALRDRLKTSLQAFGLPAKPSSRPHMTVLYDMAECPVLAVEPVQWTAKRFALILSHVGANHHEYLGEWDLKST